MHYEFTKLWFFESDYSGILNKGSGEINSEHRLIWLHYPLVIIKNMGRHLHHAIRLRCLSYSIAKRVTISRATVSHLRDIYTPIEYSIPLRLGVFLLP